MLLCDTEMIGQHNEKLGFQRRKLKTMRISLKSLYFPSFDLDLYFQSCKREMNLNNCLDVHKYQM